MSGLEKFQDSAQFRSHLKKFLLMERKPNPPSAAPTSSENQRHSLDIVEDLKIVLEEAKNPQPKKPVMFQQLQQSPQNDKDDDNTMEKENKAPTHFSAAAVAHQNQTFPATKVASNEVSTLTCCNETVYEDAAAAAGAGSSPTDESFETLERMCDKTASDPDSTLFTYLHSDCKKLVLAEAKQRSSGEHSLERTPKVYDAEADALQRLLDELRVEEQQHEVDITQLEDIEAPSRMWETTTISCGSGAKTPLQTSPVKMVGLLRPSTIIEAADESCSSSTSAQMFSSFQSAELKSGATTTTAPSEVSSSCYETAHNSSAASSTSYAAREQQQQQLFTNIDDLLGDFGEGGAAGADENFNAAQATLILPPSPSTNLIDLNADQSIDFIDLERTFAELQNSSQTSLLEETLSKFIGNKLPAPTSTAAVNVAEDSDSEDSIIEILTDDEEEACGYSSNKDTTSEGAVPKIKSESHFLSTSSLIADNVRLSRSWSSNANTTNEADSSSSHHNNKESNKENNSSACLDNSNKSLHFNDTMEEVDYILAKGMQQMAAAAAAAAASSASPAASAATKKTASKDDGLAPPPPPSPLRAKQSTFLLSPRVDDRYRSPSPMLYKQRPMTGKGTAAGTAIGTVERASSSAHASPRAGSFFAKPAAASPSSSALPKPKIADRFALVMKPVPKFELFVKPSTPRSGIPTSAAMRQKPFANIVSPIGAYMKKTGSSPLITNFKSSNQHKNADLHNATAFRTLELESRLYQPTLSKSDAAAKLKLAPARTLPKKAYISSEFKHIVDERTPVTIPGGKSIQKYLESAMIPAVVRHEGKIKLPAGVSTANTNTTSSTASTKQQTAQQHATAAGGASTSSKRTNASLADLSLMSGDVSMYTIRDAQKF